MKVLYCKVLIKDICKINSGKSIKAAKIKSDYIKGLYPCYGGNGLRGFVDLYNHDAGKPIIGRVGAQCGNIHYSKTPFYATEHALVVTITSDKINPIWLCRQLTEMSLGQYAEGAAQPVIAASKLLNLHINIPPLAEQERIVSILDKAFEKIDAIKANAEENLANAKALFQAALKKELTPKDGWEEKTIKQITTVVTDGDHQPPPKASEGIPFITISNINKEEHIVDFSNTYYVPNEYYDSLKEERKPITGDILYTVTGSFGIPVYITDNRKFCFQRHIALVRSNTSIVLPRFIYYWFMSPTAKNLAEDAANGAAQRTVSLNSLRGFSFFVPSIEKQQILVRKFDNLFSKCRKLEKNCQAVIAECDALKQAILRKAFNGEL